MHDRQDDHEHEETVDPCPGPFFGGQPRGQVSSRRASQSQRYTRGPVHFAGFGEDQEALQTDDEQNKGFEGVPLPEVASGKQYQRGEDEEARAETTRPA